MAATLMLHSTPMPDELRGFFKGVLIHRKTAASANTPITPDGLVVGSHTTAGSSYLLTDNLASTVAKIDGNQHTQVNYAYDPAGNTRTTTGASVNLTDNAIRYAGGYQTSTGLLKYGARYYDPNTSRYTQQDPSGQETNPYAYVADNPVNNVDRSGLSLGSFASDLSNFAGAGAALGTTIGAGIGLLGGPLAEITVPAGAGAGALIGTALGTIGGVAYGIFNDL